MGKKNKKEGRKEKKKVICVVAAGEREVIVCVQNRESF